ncbi:MAG TPA: 2-oxo-4-hydroxy-4-carboxy-5-ureidoimidazoline decarboxylase [Vicinamibacterales bacterium]|jgi:2-oxo-4-hydroxy-4-carboxy-5-ureidoimidazoline decarboxylase|nr:2-oxo-4-hydroxy-4-carboxy-5-ureidoimidazoline decarboxylase [Vicinamibacterales bacterium]
MERWRRIDEAPEEDAAAELRTCCGASRWIDRMLVRRPFGSLQAARAAARDEWFALSADDWKEAFAHHPRIGDSVARLSTFASGSARSSVREQAGVNDADAGLLNALLAANREYEARFGYIFIVCATGKTAAEMLAILRQRLSNGSEAEIRIAAEEHAKICDLRLAASM